MEFVKELDAVSKRLEKKPILLSLWRVVSFFLTIGTYLGAFCATMIFEILPFKILAWCKVMISKTLYWTLAISFWAVICAICVFLAVMIYRWLRVGHIPIDFILVFLASVLAAWLSSWTLLHGW